MHKIINNTNETTNNNYDIIGDIHGYASTLIALLKKLGYKKDEAGTFFHKERTMIFLGDYIDRGTEESRVIDIVRSMVDKGYALAVMGNHEFNAISYHSYHPQTQKPLREHSVRNANTHQAFLDEFPVGDKKTQDVINWFKTLPLFIELDEFRVIHACWNDKVLEEIKPKLNTDNTLPEKLYIDANKVGTGVYEAIEVLLKGIEITLPEGSFFKDKGGNKRTEIRIKWWTDDIKTYRDYAQVPDNQVKYIPDLAVESAFIYPAYPKESKPVFVGHYWFDGKPEILKSNIACLDYSVAKGEKLVCYRWNQGDSKLNSNQFSYVNCVVTKMVTHNKKANRGG